MLVTLGGGDAGDIAHTVLGGLMRIGDFPLEIHALANAGPSNWAKLQTLVDQTGSTGLHKIALERHSERMPELMAWADVAVTGGGSTALELAFMGLPSLLVSLSEDQRPNITALAAARLTVDLGDFRGLEAEHVAKQGARLAADETRRASMSRELRKLVDGQGAARVVAAMMELGR